MKTQRSCPGRRSRRFLSARWAIWWPRGRNSRAGGIRMRYAWNGFPRSWEKCPWRIQGNISWSQSGIFSAGTTASEKSRTRKTSAISRLTLWMGQSSIEIWCINTGGKEKNKRRAPCPPFFFVKDRIFEIAQEKHERQGRHKKEKSRRVFKSSCWRRWS